MATIDFSRHTFPPGGWKFFQPQTGWSAPTPVSSTFEQTAELIIKHRKMNPAATQQHQLSTDYNDVCDELENYTRKRLGLPPMGGGGLPLTQPPGTVTRAKRSGRCCGGRN